MNGIIITVDFDGTITTHEFPEIGKDIGALPILKKLTDKGHKLILNTMRSDKKGDRATLTEAVEYLKKNGIELYGIGENPTQKSWTDSVKPHSNLNIDDINLGSPLKYDPSISDRPYVDWVKVEKMLTEYGLI